MKETLFENGIQHYLHRDYYIPDLKLNLESHPVGRRNRML